MILALHKLARCRFLSIASLTTTATDPADAWDATLDPTRAFFSFSEKAAAELATFLAAQPVLDGLTEVRAVEFIPARAGDLPAFAAEARAMVDRLVLAGPRFAVAHPTPGLSLQQQLAVPWLLANLLGDTLAQNETGDRFYIITDRGGRMEEGARYSQTRQGGSFHTDGVNLKEGYDYFLLSCIAPAAHGGESVLLNGSAVHHALQHRAPEALPMLQRDFVWEYKGIQSGRYYHEPILKMVDGQPRWRYLRDYLEEAARQQDAPLDAGAVTAMDQLDAVLDDAALQFRHILHAGETVIINDRQIFHGRTPFEDHPGAVDLECHLAATSNMPLKRTYSRFWVNA
ncbi:MAG: TauD/TfdA family dioxygenase [Verrucomicrobiota bacterium]|nr:TauD/TfdA family dioxygenase [Verrucomicrobiota bacterium]